MRIDAQRQAVLDYLQDKSWVSHSDLRVAVKQGCKAFICRMGRMEKLGLVDSKIETGKYTDSRGRTISVRMRYYKLRGAQGYTLDLCSVPWLGTFIPEVPKGDGIVYRCEDGGEEWSQ